MDLGGQGPSPGRERRLSLTPSLPTAVLPAPLLRVHLAAHLQRLPAFAGCSGTELRRLAQWGDLVEMHSGEVLVHEDHRDFWFFAVMRGQVALTRHGARLGTLGPGSHLGEGAIVGLRPQPATATVTQPTILFVLGARYFLSLVATSPAFQRALFPEVEASEFRSFAGEMLAVGRTEWEQVAARERRRRRGGAAGTEPARPVPNDLSELLSPERLPARPLTLREAVARLGHVPDAPSELDASRRVAAPRWVRFAVLATLAVGLPGAAAGVLFGYHPPRAVITAGVPFDVTADVHVRGYPLPPTRGHLLLLWVQIRRPNLAGYLLSMASGKTITGVDPAASTPAAERAAAREGLAEYSAAQRAAVTNAATVLGIDPTRLDVTFKGRGLTGPSAGLVYSLALVEVLSGRDLTGGRVVAATGQLDSDGRIEPVGWVSVKAAEASGAGAVLLLVPAGQQDQAVQFGPAVFGVANLTQALDDLKR